MFAFRLLEEHPLLTPASQHFLGREWHFLKEKRVKQLTLTQLQSIIPKIYRNVVH